MGYYGNWNGMMGWGGLGFVFMLFFWGVVIFAFFVFIKWLNEQSRGGDRVGKTAVEILEERYAKGEIDREEFLRAKKDLKNGT